LAQYFYQAIGSGTPFFPHQTSTAQQFITQKLRAFISFILKRTA